ncbi:MAG: DUF58 domain-containing protein [Candidatus Cloacimonetes bacterium]|nr:DUF58 domain-containing protein [Candidatus Cloacimonadota bacterium]
MLKLLSIFTVIAFFLILLIDIYISISDIEQIKLEISPIIRLSQNKIGKIEINIEQNSEKELNLKFALALPCEFANEHNIIHLKLKKSKKKYRFNWLTKCDKRGRYQIEYFFIGLSSKWKLWDFRRKSKINVEIRVYPDLSVSRKELATFFLKRGISGVHRQQQMGKGREFEKLRDYLPGDSYEDIHWKATAKRQKPITKIFQIERTQEIYLIIDTARSSGKPLPNELPESKTESIILEKYINSALLMALTIQKQHDAFGLITFSDKVDRFIKAKAGNSSFKLCRDALFSIKTQKTNPNFEELFTFIRTNVKKRALLIFFTDLEEKVIWEKFHEKIDLISRKHFVIVNMLKTKDSNVIFSNEKIEDLNDIYYELENHLHWYNLVEAKKNLKVKGVQMNLIESRNYTSETIMTYLNAKQRQIL